MGREPAGAGARAAFDGKFTLFAVGMPMGPGMDRQIDERLDEVIEAMRPWANGSVYVNFAERGGSLAPAFDAATYARLQAARATWDPSEMFIASHRIEAA